MSRPQRIQLSRKAGWRLPEGAVSVARPTPWGNPFRVGSALRFPFDRAFGPVVRDRAHAVEVFACYADITSGYKLCARWDLSGWSLACWCPLDGPCHADVLLAIANEPMDDEEAAAFERARARRDAVFRAPRGLGRPKENGDARPRG